MSIWSLGPLALAIPCGNHGRYSPSFAGPRAGRSIWPPISFRRAAAFTFAWRFIDIRSVWATKNKVSESDRSSSILQKMSVTSEKAHGEDGNGSNRPPRRRAGCGRRSAVGRSRQPLIVLFQKADGDRQGLHTKVADSLKMIEIVGDQNEAVNDGSSCNQDVGIS